MSSSTLVPSTLSTSNLASTLRDAAELVVDVTTASAKSISDALPDSMPELAASLPAALPFVGSQHARRRSLPIRRIAIVGAVLAVVVAAAMVLRKRSGGSNDAVNPAVNEALGG